MASSAIFILPIMANIMTDPRAIKMLDTFALITGVRWAAIVAVSIIIYIVTSFLTYIAIVSIKRVIFEAYERLKMSS